jgi:hypothetical protein
MSNNLWPSQQVSTRKAGKSSYRAQPIKMDWTSGFLMMAFVLLMVVGVAAGAYHFVLEPMLAHMTSVVDTFPTLRK